MTYQVTTDPITIDELMTNIAFTNELSYYRTESEAQAAAAHYLERERRFGRFETTASVEPAGKFHPRGKKWSLFVKRNGR